MAVDHEALCDLIALRQTGGNDDTSRETGVLFDILRAAHIGTTVDDIVGIIHDAYVFTDFDEEAPE